ncbi:MAG: transcription-repair coupling factor, partial [Candidatus Eisenbacteria bacterium]|nr:transcription-repair coupling factor [Candidatus Latescibacterota bacterium]MBD3302579.1 transcription-repair coupling factor [Candidatus Eisenbacteria bacterium]
MPTADARTDLSIQKTILERFTTWPAIAEVLADLRGGAERVRLRGLTGSTRSLLAAALARERSAPILLITPETNAAEEIREDLEFLLGRRAAVHLPETGHAPYEVHHLLDPVAPVRAEILSALALGPTRALPLYQDLRVVVTTPSAWMHRVPSPERLRAMIRILRVCEEIDPDRLADDLIAAGYELNPQVGEYGDASRRGGILDVFSQRSVSTLQEMAILPTRMLVPTAEERAAAAERIRDAGGDDELVELVRDEPVFDGAEWLAGFYGIPLVPPNAYLGESPRIVVDQPAAVESASEGWDEAAGAGADAASKEERIVSPPAEIFAPLFPDDPFVRIDLGGTDEIVAGETRALATRPAERFGRNLDLTRTYLLRLRETCPEIHILCDTEAHRERLSDLLHPVPARFHVGNLAAGFEIPEIGLAVLTDHEIFARTRHRTVGRRFSRGISLKELLAMGPGDFVVHIDHGIGIYRGMSRLLVNGQETDCMTLEYAGGDKLYIPVDQLNLVQRYSAEEGHRPALNRLGSPSWARTKAKIKKRIRDMAEELLRTAAVRKARPGHRFGPDTDAQSALELAFPYEETTDQLTAISEVKGDMESDAPMDRLVCGDVGYGKTEVAIRAAFKAVMGEKQVAVLVPTTLLAEQHYDTFRERLEDFPIRVEMLSRFRSPAEQKVVIRDLKEGKVDVVIGTHRLVSKDVGFRDLGFLIIDEEHRFGVAHKEKLKKIRETVDVLSLTATPIPRTLHMALSGGRDMTTINTPPRDRRPIQTEIVEFRDDVIAHALMREADRGGQAFFVHNRIESIDAMANYLAGLVPHLRLAIAHGAMREHHLEKVMRAFLEREYDVLVSTTIIESGLDFPNVNTILINRGDTFGLAQLYQLRGRVGRSARKAYAYLLVPPYRSITETAQKRLKAIEEFGDLGSGFQLAMRDLEIRGAGNLLGAEQHGFILNVGFDLYCRLLDETVRELKGIAPERKTDARVVTDIEAYLPDEYVPDNREKMTLYKSIADTQDLDALSALEEEIRDRFGMLPDPGRHLLDLRRIRLLAGEAEI